MLKHDDGLDRGIFASIIMTSSGKGNFFFWLPDDACELTVISDDEAAPVSGENVQVTVEKSSVLRLITLMLWRKPTAVMQLLTFALIGNSKGAKVRFLRALRRLSEPSYSVWLSAQREATRTIASDHEACRKSTFLITIDHGAPDQVLRTRKSLAAQASLIQQELSVSEVGNYLDLHGRSPDLIWMKLPAGAVLEPNTLRRLGAEFQRHPLAAAIYTDEDSVDEGGKAMSPFFKPAWNLPLVQSGWLPVEGAAIRTSYLDPDFDLQGGAAGVLLAIAKRYGSVVKHLPIVALHRSAPYVNCRSSALARSSAKDRKVSVIIPTRDRSDLLRSCLEGVFSTADEYELDVIVVDNDSREAATFELLQLYAEKRGVRRVAMPGEFNFSRACNIGVNAARFGVILLLNNDTEPRSKDWLSRLVEEIQVHDVGAAGGLLLYPDGLVQHGGITLSPRNVAYNTFQFFDPRQGEDRGLLAERRDVSAVTGACLITRKSLWAKVGGMDEINLPVAFNDVDYCLKLRKHGLRIVWTPSAVLLHRESVSRKADKSAHALAKFRQEERFMLVHWREALAQDPFHSPNCGLLGDEFTLEALPRNQTLRELPCASTNG